MRFSTAIACLFSVKFANAFTVGPSALSVHSKQSIVLASSNDGWYDDYDEFAAKLDFNDGGWDNSPSSYDRPRSGGGGGRSGGARASRNDYNDYSRDPSDTSPIDESLITNLLSQRTDMRRKGMFDEADNIRDELMNVHGVTVWDRDRVWTTKSGAVRGGGRGGGRGDRGGRGRGGGRGGGRGRGSGRGRGRDRQFNEHGHDYFKVGGPIDPSICTLPEREIHMLIRERMECKFDRNFQMADSIQRELLSYGVEVHDGYKEWRADGETWGTYDSFRALNKGPREARVYVRRGPAAGMSDEDLETIEQLVADRSEAKLEQDYDKADAIYAELGRKYNVNVDDRKGEWALRHEEYQMSSDSSIVPDLDVMKVIGNKLADRITARKNRDFELADQIREELEDEYLVKVDDKNKEWKIVQPEGARWADDEDDEGADEVSGSNYVSKAEFDDDDEEMDEDDGFDESEDDEPETGVEDLSSFTVPQLKAKLKEAGLPVSGVKAELIERLSTVQ